MILKLRFINNLFCETLRRILCVWNEMIYCRAGIFIAMQLKSEIPPNNGGHLNFVLRKLRPECKAICGLRNIFMLYKGQLHLKRGTFSPAWVCWTSEASTSFNTVRARCLPVIFPVKKIPMVFYLDRLWQGHHTSSCDTQPSRDMNLQCWYNFLSVEASKITTIIWDEH